MKTTAIIPALFRMIRCTAIVLLVFSAGLARGDGVFWNGPSTNFVQFSPDPSDQLTANVAISRLSSGPLYNSVTETYPDGATSPADTMWCFGTFEDVTNGTISWQYFADIRNNANGDLADAIKFHPMVMHLLTDNIYVSVYFTKWGTNGEGGFSYQRSTPNVVVATPPALSITSPTNGAVFADPASIKISAGVTNGTDPVTSVAFFANTNTSLGSKSSAPYTLTTGNLGAGVYALTAVATAGGISTTSAAVNINVVTALAVSGSAPKITNGIFSFNYTANPGLKYVVQSSSNLIIWLPVATNTAVANPVHFTDNFASNSNRYYRVDRLPNP